MNKNIKLAVAGAVLALSATAANAGIIIPAGEWTIDIGGNVNAYATTTRLTGETNARGKSVLWGGTGSGDVLNAAGSDARTQSNITTGLLPNYLSVTGTTRQNDLDVSFTISINPGSSTLRAGGQSAMQENRQAFMTFGDKSWGSIKLGKDLGIFASDAILNDMTLLGVGAGAGTVASNTTTLGRIGTGFIYADWKSQIAYTTPNMSGFQATVGITQGWNSQAYDSEDLVSTGRSGAGYAYEGKASYSFSANDVTGKVWVSGLAQKFNKVPTATAQDETVAYAGDIGATVNAGGFGVTGYYYAGQGIGQTLQFMGAFDTNGKMRDSTGGYVQATYVLPSKTKLGVSWGESTIESTGSADALTRDVDDSMWVAGLYHPLTKHLNLVAEYADVESKHQDGTAKGRTGSLGAILFF
jgi:predicted porin